MVSAVRSALTALLGVGALQVAQEQERSAQLSEALSGANQRHAEAMAAMQVQLAAAQRQADAQAARADRCGYNLPCAHQYVGKSQSCMVQGRTRTGDGREQPGRREEPRQRCGRFAQVPC